MSRGLGIFISPPLARAVVEHVRFLLLPDNRVLVVLITSGGQTRDKLVRPERAFLQTDLDRTADYLNRHYVGWTLDAMRADLRAQVERDREQYGRLAGDALIPVSYTHLRRVGNVHRYGTVHQRAAAQHGDEVCADRERGRSEACLLYTSRCV